MATQFHVETYRGRRNLLGRKQWRWRAVHNVNGEVLASGEGYNNLNDMLDTLETLFAADVIVKVPGS